MIRAWKVVSGGRSMVSMRSSLSPLNVALSTPVSTPFLVALAASTLTHPPEL